MLAARPKAVLLVSCAMQQIVMTTQMQSKLMEDKHQYMDNLNLLELIFLTYVLMQFDFSVPAALYIPLFYPNTGL